MEYQKTQNQTILTYTQSINSPEIITEDETIRLIQKAQKGDNAARDRVCYAYCNIVFYCVKRGNYTQNSSDTADFLQEGTIGLLKAIEHYSPKKGAAFSTYAPNWINKYLWDYCRRNQFIIKPDKKFRLLAKLARIEKEYETRYGKAPDLKTLCGLLSLSLEETQKLKKEQLCFCMFAEDAFSDASGFNIDDFFNKMAFNNSSLNDIDDNVESVVLEKIHTKELYQRLTTDFCSGTDRDILDIILLSGNREPLSIAKIAQKLSFSKTYISKRIQKMRPKVGKILLELNPDLNLDRLLST